ncbi:acetyltransferase [Cladophialophora psammophila CBS 110553]|uniref:Acetyltransferase n=1 Tax=Cladophialophora psammophila CBS 110553 TaxID=1182543 RepID=W9X789_9EURO|nr:acetyltransferase [Cladophialophora psammophila CBS 110553]EXJ72791.1 acetyltransferase [Cladophialophora psammophila CBS 110553]
MLNHPEWQKAQRGELYHAFVPELIAARDRCKQACDKLNSSAWITRRRAIELWREITNDTRPLPPQQASLVEHDKLFEKEPWIVGPIHADYGFNIVLGEGAQLNFNSSFVDTCPIRIGARTLVGPNCSFYSGTHPLDPALRNGTNGPELGKEISIGEDCWLGGNVIILPGVTIGRGCTVGAGSVVTKDIPAFHVAAGNPARILRKIQTPMDSTKDISRPPEQERERGGEGVTTE